jgi:hypothetical protein
MQATFDDLIVSAEADNDLARKRHAKALATIRMIHGRLVQEGRSSMTPDEEGEVAAQKEIMDRAARDHAGAKKRLGELRALKVQEDDNTRAMDDITPDPRTQAAKPAYDRVARIGAEKRTYNPDNCRRGAEFLKDVLAAKLGNDVEANLRLTHHMQEERSERGQYLVERATGTGAFSGLTVPQYLTELYAPAVSARRPLADAMTKLDLPPSGMTVNISRITTSSSVANQANENDAASETNMDDTLLTENVLTAAGRQTISRQAVERGAGIEQVTMRDLQRQYAKNLDLTIITQATTGLAAVAVANTYDDTSPTGVEFYRKLIGAMAGSEAALLGEATPDLAVMHSRRWFWLQAEMTNQWPLIGQQGISPQSAGINYAERYGAGFRGLLPNGTVVIVDNNIATNLGAGTNQDEVYIVPSEESYLWEDPNAPQFIRTEEAKAENLGVVLVLYGYYAYTLRRYANSHQKVSGTGLVTPSF